MKSNLASAFALSAAALAMTACGGGLTPVQPGDAGPVGAGPADGMAVTPRDGGAADSTTIYPSDARPSTDATSGDSSVDGGEGGLVIEDASGGAPVDAGYYHGDGSFWVDGGAYPVPDAGMQLDASTPDVDASSGCGPLAACCPSLQGASQGLCNDIVAQANAADCAAELSQLEGAGSCAGTTVLASQIQVQPNLLVSDGNLLFWTTTGSPSLLAMPVTGGPITVLLNDAITNPAFPSFTNPFLAVDNANVYVLMNNSIVRIPKDGSPATLVNEPGARVQAATALGSTAYWTEFDESPPVWWISILKSAPLQGTTVSQVATFVIMQPEWSNFAVTSDAVFASSYFFPLSSVPPNGMTTVTSVSANCGTLTSDTNAVYCNCTSQNTCSNTAISSAGTATTLGQGISPSYIVSDDTYAYWADMTTVGTIMKAPKAGGGTATVVARDTSPTAIAVDANSIYWSDQAGYIKSVPK